MYIQITQMHILPPLHIHLFPTQCKINLCGVFNTCPTLPTSTPIRLNIYIARAVRDLKHAADDGRRQRRNHLLPLAELRRERRRAPHTSLVTTRGRCARTAGDGPSPSCLSSSCTVAHSRQQSASILVAAAEVQPQRERRRAQKHASLRRRCHKGRCACRYMITCALPCDQQLPLSHRQSSSFGRCPCTSLYRQPSSPSPTLPSTCRRPCPWRQRSWPWRRQADIVVFLANQCYVGHRRFVRSSAPASFILREVRRAPFSQSFYKRCPFSY